MRPDDFSWLQVLFREMNALKPYLASSFVRKTTFPSPVPVLSKLLSNSEGKLLSLKGALYIIGMLSKYASILIR